MKTIKRVRLKQVCDGRIRFTVDRVAKPRDVYDAVLPYYRGADREILSASDSMLVMRFVDPDAHRRYGTFIYVRCR